MAAVSAEHDENYTESPSAGAENIMDSAVYSEGQLSCLERDLDEIPEELIDAYADKTIRLDLSGNRIQSLHGLEHFSRLQELVLDNNRLCDDIIFPLLPSLTTLFLNKNRFLELNPLLNQLKASCPNLIYLSLLGNSACPNQLSSTDKDDEDYQRYRYYVLFHLPKLKFLDSGSVTQTELVEAQRRGQYMQVVRPAASAEEDEDELDLAKELTKEKKDEHPLQMLTLQQVDKACILLAEKCISKDARNFFKSGSRPAILEITTFLFDCLGKRTKFPTTAREKAWSAFHVAYQKHMVSVQAVTGSAQASMWLCFHLFELLLDMNYPITPQENEVQEEETLSEDVKDVVSYIGGSVVQKLKQRCLRLKPSDEKEEKLQCLKHFVQNDEDQASVLTSALNRGGLVFLQQNSKDFFYLLERKARLVFQTNIQQEFSVVCSQSQEVFTLFQDMTSECEVSDGTKEQVFVQMAQMYFKIRIHHECRKYLDKLKCDTCIPAKGLRKGLKEK